MLKRALASGYTFVGFDEVLDDQDSELNLLNPPLSLVEVKKIKVGYS